MLLPVCQIVTSTPWSGLRKERRQEGLILTCVKTCANMPLEGLRQDLCPTHLGAEVMKYDNITCPYVDMAMYSYTHRYELFMYA